MWYSVGSVENQFDEKLKRGLALTVSDFRNVLGQDTITLTQVQRGDDPEVPYQVQDAAYRDTDGSFQPTADPGRFETDAALLFQLANDLGTEQRILHNYFVNQ
jgi:hypothetical protein